MPPRKIILKVGPSRVPRGGKSVKGPKKGLVNAPKSTTKKRRASSSSLSSTSSLDLSDEDGYSGVEDVSDSDDDDEEHVFAAEEEHIITHELHRKQPATPSSPRPSTSDLDNDDEENAADADDDESDDDNDNENFLESMDEDVDEIGSVSWNGFTSENDEPVLAELDTAEPVSTTPVERHVRFAGVPDSESDSDETEEDVDDFFPDIFIAQDSLDSNFRREIEQDDDDDSSVSATYWDYTGAGGAEEDSEDDPYAIEDIPGIFGGSNMNTIIESAHSAVPDVPESEEEKESDGYESDGETTEEDEPELVPRKKLMSVRRGVSGEQSESDRSAGGTPRPNRSNTGSKKKPILVLNPVTRKMMIITPQKKRRFDVVLDPEQFQTDYFSLPTTNQSSSIIGNPGALMMSAMSSANFFAGGAMDFQTVGPTEAFFPAASDPYVEFMGDESEDSFLVEADDEDDGEEKNLNIEDFLDFGEGDTDGEGQAADNDDGITDITPSRRASTAPSATSDSNTDVHPLLSHFTNNADAVGAFRRNQVNQQLILNGQATQESLAFSNPLYHGTLRGIKHGSLGGAATPLTPERRHKKALAKSPSDAVNQKRKASTLGADDGHVRKRQQSISDVKAMHL
ncbi:hypothetical protein VM1G_10287 [Cytospora mali]|uniref:Uncharacterized protein n=1 Tax=Cytospora mali TaxID=578113 RepID=A0A194VHY0_CYTMA|nr:hypothetical protein VM1G_10287 [Valsa mali]